MAQRMQIGAAENGAALSMPGLVESQLTQEPLEVRFQYLPPQHATALRDEECRRLTDIAHQLAPMLEVVFETSARAAR